MKRPPIFPPPQFPPVRLRPFQRMPPAVFPCIMGLFGLGLALRRGAEAVGYPPAIAELLLGAVSLLWAFATLGYAFKLVQRPSVLMEDLANLPGRAGLAAMSLGLLLLAATVLPYATGLAQGFLVVGLVAHAGFAGLILLALIRAPAEAREVTPVWHLHFGGFIIAGLTAAPLGWDRVSALLLWGTLAVAGAIWAIGARQLLHRVPPAPLRPLLAIHLGPAALLGLVALLSGMTLAAQIFAVFGAGLLLALVLAARWMTQSGFSAFWGAFTFPLAFYAALLLGLGAATGQAGWLWSGVAVLIAAIGIVPGISIRVMQAWMQGSLAAKTNAATA